jgi:pimeloyl-ACP methyl ester carboxylesterase
MSDRERRVRSGDAELCTETFGRRGDPPVLLIMGQTASMLWWPDAFVERVAAAGRFVVRYDHRDTGRSTSYEPGRPPYTADDLVADAVAVLDGHGLERAHVVGMSMGGGLAQRVALEHPDRVATLTAISTSPVGVEAELPGPRPEYLAHAAAFESLDWSDTEALTALLVCDARALAGTRHPFDEAAARELIARDLARARNAASMLNHTLLSGGEDHGARAAAIAAPTLVVHGEADPIFPLAHGEALAAAVPGARLVVIPGGGHELHAADLDRIADAIIAHIEPA